MKNKTMVMLTCIFIGCMISACGNNNEDSYLAETEKENIQIQETENETEEIVMNSCFFDVFRFARGLKSAIINYDRGE